MRAGAGSYQQPARVGRAKFGKQRAIWAASQIRTAGAQAACAGIGWESAQKHSAAHFGTGHPSRAGVSAGAHCGVIGNSLWPVNPFYSGISALQFLLSRPS